MRTVERPAATTTFADIVTFERWPALRGVYGRLSASLPMAYWGALAIWVITRGCVVLYQGDWLWMNSFVIETAHDMMTDHWDQVVRPALPSALAVPFLAAGLSGPSTVVILYLFASLFQFGAFAAAVRALFRDRPLEQVLALGFFLLAPMNHSIPHWRNIPTVVASGAAFLLAAHWLRVWARSERLWSARSIAWVAVALAAGIWSRTEVLTFVGALLLLGAVVYRRRILGTVALYGLVAVVMFGLVTLQGRVSGTDPGMISIYQIHTFLDSTPESWLSDSCRNFPTENCRDAEGSVYFAPVDRQGGLLKLLLAHPILALAKTARSAFDNVWTLLGANISTFPGLVWLVIGALLLNAPSRAALRRLPAAAWPVAGAILALTVLPPLSWAPPHPQYHLHIILLVTIVSIPVLASLLPTARGNALVTWVYLGNAALSAFRYTRYAGY